ncbi:MAG: dienelactone hydrolase family protein [Armatimonadetes bacterium]|nr:dienelactone hydrolase family protein [Armatimonadota bacterium]
MERVLATVATLGISLSLALGQGKPTELTLKASDGKSVFGRLFPAKGTAKGVVLMFHQARSNMEEYAPIAPKVAELGFDCLTIDQRSGGDMWGAKNRTAASYSSAQDYLSAYPDLEGALDWAKAKSYGKIVAWGSSYSAALSLKLAAEHPEVSAVLSFSPGEYFGEKGTVAGWNAKIKAPVLMAFSRRESGNGGYDLFKTAGKFPARSHDAIIVHADGVHGSSTLRADKNPKSNDYYWKGVETFLKHAF